MRAVAVRVGVNEVELGRGVDHMASHDLNLCRSRLRARPTVVRGHDAVAHDLPPLLSGSWPTGSAAVPRGQPDAHVRWVTGEDVVLAVRPHDHPA